MRCLRKGVATDSLLGVCVVVRHGLHEHHHDHEEVTEGGLGGQKSIFQESTESGPYGHRTIRDGVGVPQRAVGPSLGHHTHFWRR